MTITGYLMGGIALLGVVGSIGGYFYGRSDGQAIEQAAQARADKAAAEERKKRELELGAGEQAGQTAEVERSTQTREVYREVERIVPGDVVYRNVCVTGDGVRALDRAAGIANGADPGQPAGETAGAAQGAPPP